MEGDALYLTRASWETIISSVFIAVTKKVHLVFSFSFLGLATLIILNFQKDKKGEIFSSFFIKAFKVL